MQKIILASASAQRKKLLEMAGVKFSVVPSRAQELHKITANCSGLVKHNALLKARDVANRCQQDLVIGADTLVYAGHRRVIGKPKDLADAKRILRLLCSGPHWVYTGVAIIDAKSGQTLIDYEKTKLYMHKLSDEEIAEYHKHTNPLDKAGGFDIEGRGGLFIRRVEGCYSNVIGLPLPKLRVMLKSFGVSIL
jgi:septum formation protein